MRLRESSVEWLENAVRHFVGIVASAVVNGLKDTMLAAEIHERYIPNGPKYKRDSEFDKAINELAGGYYLDNRKRLIDYEKKYGLDALIDLLYDEAMVFLCGRRVAGILIECKMISAVATGEHPEFIKRLWK